MGPPHILAMERAALLEWTRVTAPFQQQFLALFEQHFQRLFRYLDRMSGDPDLAADLAQEAFIRLYRRGESPNLPEAWLIAVATNLLRNAKSKQARRSELLVQAREADVLPIPTPSPADAVDAAELQQRVRRALDGLPERERQLLLLRAEGYSYRDLAHALDLNEASIGTLLARAKRAFRELYEEGQHASRR